MIYETIKESIVRILGKKFLKRNDTFLRKVFLYPLYVGNKKMCTVCEKKLRNFIQLSNGELLCPYCGSLKRNRRLINLLGSKLIEGISVLEFSPSKCIFDKLKRMSGINYTSTDFVGEFKAEKHYDITNIESDPESYSIILCYHILEHIENDSKAISELYRILKQGGVCFIQTPFKSGETYENVSIKSSKERIEHFGQHDHVRVYSIDGLKNRLESAGFRVDVLRFKESAENRYGFSENETVLLASKS